MTDVAKHESWDAGDDAKHCSLSQNPVGIWWMTMTRNGESRCYPVEIADAKALREQLVEVLRYEVSGE